MRKFWEDLKRTLKLYLAVLLPSLLVTLIVALVWDEEISHYAAMGCGILGGLWIIHYEWKHDVWGRRKCTENLGPKDNSSSGS